MEGVTWALANFALNLKFEDLDPDLIHHFKEYLLDGKPYACCASSHSSIDVDSGRYINERE